MNSVSFTANLVHNTSVPQRKSLFSYKDTDVSIVEIERTNPSDLDALDKASGKWIKNRGEYAEAISFDASYGTKDNEFIRKHFYALTTQNSNHEHLIPEKILGLMMFEETKNPENEIVCLEVNPSTSKSKSLIRKYKQVGRRLVEFVQSNFDQKAIYVYADCRALNFYKKLGFKQQFKDLPRACEMHWSI